MKMINLLSLLLLSFPSYAGIKTSVEYGMGFMPDNAGNVAILKDITAVTMEDNSNVGESSSAIMFSLGYEGEMFGVRGKYYFDSKADTSTELIKQNGADFVRSTTDVTWDNYSVDFYMIFNKKGMFRPYLGAGYSFVSVKLYQKWEDLTGSNTPGNPVDAQGNADGLFYYAGTDIMLTKSLGFGIQYTMYTNKVEEYTLNSPTKLSTGTPQLNTGDVLRYFNAAADGYSNNNITTDLSRSEIIGSLFFNF